MAVRSKTGTAQTVSVGGSNEDAALSVVSVAKGHVRLLLRAKFLFDENSATFKAGMVDTLAKAASFFQAKDINQIEVTLINDLDPFPTAQALDADRALAVFALLNFKRLELS